MIKFKELSKKYTPDNISTNFSNSTCRRRLLDKYIGAGKWEYVYDGRKAVGINLIDQEEEVIEPVVEEEVVQEQEETLVEEQQTSQPTTMKECDKEIEKCEKTILELQNRIKELKQLKIDLTPSHIIFKSRYRFRKYGALENITKVYEEGTDYYNKHKNEYKMDKLYKDFLLSYAKCLRRHLSYRSIYKEVFDYHSHCSDRTLWEKYFEKIYWSEKGELIHYERRTMKDFEGYFIHSKDRKYEDIKQEMSKYHDIFEEAYNIAKNINKEAANILKQFLDNEKANLKAFEQAKIDDAKSFTQFKNEYNKYKFENDRYYKRKKSKQERFYEDFFGSKNNYRARSYKYFTGTYNTLQDLKSEYRKLSRIYHPDMSTGSTEKFQEMQQEYESLKKNFAA